MSILARFIDERFLAGRLRSTSTAGMIAAALATCMFAYRYYVEQLSGKARLSHEDETMIQGSLHGISDVQEFMERTSHVLSLISHNVGVAVAMSGPKNALEHVYFSRLGDQKVLAVVVTKSGVVRDRVLRLDLSQSDLDEIALRLNQRPRQTLGFRTPASTLQASVALTP